jgi:DHA3 family macrolide efflux protein-like MFS transporter
LPAGAKAGGGQYIRELKEGLSYIKRHDFMLRYFIFLSAFFILLTPAALLTPLQVTRDFGGEVWQLSAIEIAFAAGMSAGGIFIGIWGGFKNKMITIIVGLILFGVEAIGLGLLTNFIPYLICMGVMGLTVPLANTPGTAVMQTKTDPAYMGRVFSVIAMISSVLMPLGMVFFGPLSDIVPVDTLLIATGAGTIILAFLMRADKKLMAAGE